MSSTRKPNWGLFWNARHVRRRPQPDEFYFATLPGALPCGRRCSTDAPATWAGFVKQQLRWKKSWVRETTIAVRHMYKEHPAVAIAYYSQRRDHADLL